MKYSITLLMSLLTLSLASGAMENSARIAHAEDIEPIERPQAAIKPEKHLEIIDINGKAFTLEPHLAKSLLECTAFEVYEDFPGILDFSQISEKKDCLKKELLVVLARLIYEYPQKLVVLPKDAQLFELAHFLGASDTILYILANELWSYMQESAQDSKKDNDSKKNLRKLAQPYLSSPTSFLHYLKSQPQSKVANFRKSTIVGKYIDLSFDTITNVFYANNNPYDLYPFRSLAGIQELFKYLGIDQSLPWSLTIDLKNHKLETFSCDLFPSIDTFDLSNNNISQLTQAQFNFHNRLPEKIILNGNPIRSIDDSFFTIIRKERATKKYVNFELSLENTNLSMSQKKQIQNKFYKAINTIPERFFNKKKLEDTWMISSTLIGGVSTFAMLSSLKNFIRNSEDALIAGAIITPLATICGASLGLITGEISYNIFSQFLGCLALTSHPEMKSQNLKRAIWKSENNFHFTIKL